MDSNDQSDSQKSIAYFLDFDMLPQPSNKQNNHEPENRKFFSFFVKMDENEKSRSSYNPDTVPTSAQFSNREKICDYQDKNSKETLNQSEKYVKLSDLDQLSMTRSLPACSLSNEYLLRTCDSLHDINELFAGLEVCQSVGNVSSEPKSLVTEELCCSEFLSSMGWNLLRSCSSQSSHDSLLSFLEGRGTDICLSIFGKAIKCHRNILQARCAYFAGLLSGDNNKLDVIVMKDMPLEVVYFIICVIYCGINNIPECINLKDLAYAAQRFSVIGLDEMIMFKLKEKYSHGFHKPCQTCIINNLSCLEICNVYGLDDLYTEIHLWITDYFDEIWPTKEFAQLPEILRQHNKKYVAGQVSKDNFMEKLQLCALSVVSLPVCDWGVTIIGLIDELLYDIAIKLKMYIKEILQIVIENVHRISDYYADTIEQLLFMIISIGDINDTLRAYYYLNEHINYDMECSGLFPATHSQQYWVLVYEKLFARCEKVLIENKRILFYSDILMGMSIEFKKKLAKICNQPYVVNNRSSKYGTISGVKSLNREIKEFKRNFVPYVSCPQRKIEQSHTNVGRPTKAYVERLKHTQKLSQDNTSIQNQRVLRDKYKHVSSKYMESQPLNNSIDIKRTPSRPQVALSVSNSRVIRQPAEMRLPNKSKIPIRKGQQKLVKLFISDNNKKQLQQKFRSDLALAAKSRSSSVQNHTRLVRSATFTK